MCLKTAWDGIGIGIGIGIWDCGYENGSMQFIKLKTEKMEKGKLRQVVEGWR